MEDFALIALGAGAFLLGSCPFSLWVGRWFLGRDIRDYGDGNPGMANVLRAGGKKSAVLALLLDLGKGMPFVVIASSLLRLSETAVTIVVLSAILGSAFSPLLRFRGGKSVAVTYGALLALPEHDMLIALAIFMVLGFIFIEQHAWAVMAGPIGSLAYFLITRGNSWQSLLMLGILAVLAVKHHEELQIVPRFTLRPAGWHYPRKR